LDFRGLLLREREGKGEDVRNEMGEDDRKKEWGARENSSLPFLSILIGCLLPRDGKEEMKKGKTERNRRGGRQKGGEESALQIKNSSHAP